ncbi:acyl-CoA/acyl-ACP dehydrogenase [Saccharopolyspora sp. HNM0983]|uniref:Acyl-CoA/acyl-ACP dehydrogenase n=1 Tax=Saccharopolyspora montiporae TaxID=2781240 RepID=A0A929G149_9PSEU|nr:acyl-CoA dehydrogenase family protein [Saccharopolyspora sp. HNM0983]MBE9375472.1 acyl-CoA/acyl-ACP dehydrogenase [Saccharopolyspora sp. HNM0983]
MDFTPTEAQTDLSGLARTILTDATGNDRLREIDEGTDRFDAGLWAELAAADVLSAALPDHAGGGGFGVLEQCSVLVECGRSVAPVPYLTSIAAAADTIARFGTAEQCAKWARPAAAGDLVLTAALTEPGDPDPAQPACRARQADGGWVLDGTKCAVPAAGIADLVLVPATADDGRARVFLVAPQQFQLHRQQVVDGDSEGWLELSGVRVGSDHVLDDDGALPHLVRRALLGHCALQLGIVERALELTAEYAGQREQFGRPIGTFQAVGQRLADGFIDVEAVRLTLWQAAWRLAEGLDCDADIATAKFWAAEAGHRVAHTAVHVHGGVGIDLDHPLHRYFVAAKRTEFALGGATAQLTRLSGYLDRDPA